VLSELLAPLSLSLVFFFLPSSSSLSLSDDEDELEWEPRLLSSFFTTGVTKATDLLL